MRSCVSPDNPYSFVQSLHGKRVLTIDLAAIVAGSGVRGQFEEKFKALLSDIEAEVRISYP